MTVPPLIRLEVRHHRSLGDETGRGLRLPLAHFITMNCPKPWAIDTLTVVELGIEIGGAVAPSPGAARRAVCRVTAILTTVGILKLIAPTPEATT